MIGVMFAVGIVCLIAGFLPLGSMNLFGGFADKSSFYLHPGTSRIAGVLFIATFIASRRGSDVAWIVLFASLAFLFLMASLFLGVTRGIRR